MGEIEADGLADDVTADWAAVVENSTGYAAVNEFVQADVRGQLESTFKREISLARARLKQEVDRRLATLPEHRRHFAEIALHRIMQRFYGEPDERLRPIVSVVLDALERDEYRLVLEKIHEAEHGDVAALADGLREFGILELSNISRQASNRMEFLDHLDRLIADVSTTEAVVHRALATNLWVFGSEFALMSTNQTLARVVQAYTDEKFGGKKAARRPDLLLLDQCGGSYTLIEFKRPSRELERSDVSQAEAYRDALMPNFYPMQVFVIGGKFDPVMLLNLQQNTRIASYSGLVSRARSELSWLLQRLAEPTAAIPHRA